MSKKLCFVLGAVDPEMNRIAALLLERGEAVIEATADGRRVHPGNAYAADPVQVPTDTTSVWVECHTKNAQGGIIIDHHRPGDPGFGRPAAEFWEASSLGQLYQLLELGEPSPEDRVFAAMDHCFAAAVRGECPWVTRDDVLAVKCREIAASTRSPLAFVTYEVERFKDMVANAPNYTIGKQVLRDLRHEYLGEGYSLALLAAQTAATVFGAGVILRHRDTANGPEKWSLSGHIDAETVNAFMNDWAPSHRLVKIYGVPDRGYAGGYLPRS